MFLQNGVCLNIGRGKLNDQQLDWADDWMIMSVFHLVLHGVTATAWLLRAACLTYYYTITVLLFVLISFVTEAASSGRMIVRAREPRCTKRRDKHKYHRRAAGLALGC
jgi:hypothetical protein